MLDANTISWLGALSESMDLGDGTHAWHASPRSDMQSFIPNPLDWAGPSSLHIRQKGINDGHSC